MAHVAKYTRGAIGHLFKHFERARDENGNYIKFSNQDIDESKTHQNYNLAPHHNRLKYIHERINEVQCLKRKDINVMCSWVITAPKELPEKYQESFFKLCYEFLKARYDPQEKNVISSYVHFDEISPHLHYAFIPVVFDEKKKKEKVSAKELITKKDLQTFHTDFQKFIEEKLLKPHGYTFECNILNGATENGNLTIQGLKAKTLEEKNRDELERMQELVQACKTLQNDVEMLSVKKNTMLVEKNALKGKIDALEGMFQTFADIESVGKKSLTGKVVMTVDEADALKKQAMAYYAANSKASDAERRIINLQRRYADLEREAPKLRRRVADLICKCKTAKQEITDIVTVLKSNPELFKAFNQQMVKLRCMEEEQQRQHNWDIER